MPSPLLVLWAACAEVSLWGLSQMHLPESGEDSAHLCNSYTTSKGRILPDRNTISRGKEEINTSLDE